MMNDQRKEPRDAMPILILFVVINLIFVALGVWKLVELFL